MNETNTELVTIDPSDVATVTGGAILVGGECIAGCPGGRTASVAPGGGITAEELWRDQLNKKR